MRAGRGELSCVGSGSGHRLVERCVRGRVVRTRTHSGLAGMRGVILYSTPSRCLCPCGKRAGSSWAVARSLVPPRSRVTHRLSRVTTRLRWVRQCTIFSRRRCAGAVDRWCLHPAAHLAPISPASFQRVVTGGVARRCLHRWARGCCERGWVWLASRRAPASSSPWLHLREARVGSSLAAPSCFYSFWF